MTGLALLGQPGRLNSEIPPELPADVGPGLVVSDDAAVRMAARPNNEEWARSAAAIWRGACLFRIGPTSGS